jgi:hypothetical protein
LLVKLVEVIDVRPMKKIKALHCVPLQSMCATT